MNLLGVLTGQQFGVPARSRVSLCGGLPRTSHGSTSAERPRERTPFSCRGVSLAHDHSVAKLLCDLCGLSGCATAGSPEA
jgi:hypothetical protein